MGELNPAAEQPEKVGPYRLEQKLGTGGMGAVWRAWDERLKRPVALKRILPAANDDPKHRERFRREAEAVARLNHPAIVHVYDIVETEESDWIVMELVEGRTLQELVQQEGPLDPQRAVRLGSEIAHGLAEAHAKGFIHRDLKAPNVMVTPAGRAKILDFGVAKQILPEAQETTLSAPGTVVGTSYAMSPEQAMGLPIDARSDLFALGSLLYEALTGVAPFRADTAQATLVRVCSFRQRPVSSARPDLPRELSNLIDRLLEKDRTHRPTSAIEVAEALDQIATETSLSAAAQASRGEVQTSDQKTLLEGPPPISLIESHDLQIPSSVASAATEPVRSSEGTQPREIAQNARGFRTAWIAAGIALFLILLIATIYLSRSPIIPPTPHAVYEQGMAYLDRFDRKGNLDRAIESFQRVISQDETHAAAHAGLAEAYWLKLQTESRDPVWLDRALPMAERAVALDPYLAIAHSSLGLALGSSGRHEEALRHIERALALDPQNGDAYYAAGRSYDSQGKLKEAEEAYKSAIEVQPHRTYFDELGSLYLRIGRTEEAIKAFRRSIEIAPDGFKGYRNLGVAYYALGNLAEASSQLQKALQIQPDASIYANLGTVQFAQGFYPRAAEAFERALEMPAGANDYLIWANLGDACRWTPDKQERAREAYDTAVQLLQKKLLATPDDPVLRSQLTLYLAKSENLRLALVELDRLEQRPEKDARLWFRMAVAYELCAKREEALAALEQALRVGFSVDEVKSDPELLGLRADARYHRLMTEISRNF
jgi:serine/threonine protein kinase/Flp pilus assembly protein TadD